MPAPVTRQFRIVENRIESEGTFTLILEPADGVPLFSFLAGQFVMLLLTNPDGTPWAKAAYSIATAPTESKYTIELAIKLAGEFTQRASKLSKGDTVGVQGPYGMFTLKANADPLVFIAGGVGVTPLRSMIREALLESAPQQVFLFYSDKTRAAMAYEDEFRSLAETYQNFHFIPCLTRETPVGWDGECTRIDGALIKKHLTRLGSARFYTCGPTALMDEVKQILITEDIDVKTRLHKESFG